MTSDIDFLISLLSATLRLATPLLLASLGEILDQRSGILNMGLEGIMAVGAFTAFTITYFTGDVLLGVLAAILTGVGFGLIHAFVSINLRVNQTVMGLALALLGVGLGGFLYRGVFGIQTLPPQIPDYIHLKVFIPGAENIPIIGPILFDQSFFFFLAIVVAPVLALVLSRTTIGLRIKAVGENPKAADTVGINVSRTRYYCVIFGSIMAGLAGASLSLDVGTFREYMVAGRGWIAIALVAFSRWNPYVAIAGALLFGGADALQLRLQTIYAFIPSYIFWMLPYILTMIVMVFLYRGAGAPASLGQPYKRGE
jgi:ABC-type uncharacterized transport system permease subunit